MIRYYLIPALVVGTARTPKYLRNNKYNRTGMAAKRVGIDYGLQNTFLVKLDVTTAQHSTLSGYSDVVAVPQNINNKISSTALEMVKSKLEDLKIPADWVTTNHTYRQVLRFTAILFQIAQHVHRHFGKKIFESGINLNTKWKDLPVIIKYALISFADRFRMNKSEVTANSTVRQVLKELVRQWPFDIRIGGVNL